MIRNMAWGNDRNAGRKRASIACVIAVFVIWLALCTGLAVAGTLTVSLEPSLDGKEGDIKATSITKAEWFVPDG